MILEIWNDDLFSLIQRKIGKICIVPNMREEGLKGWILEMNYLITTINLYIWPIIICFEDLRPKFQRFLKN